MKVRAEMNVINKGNLVAIGDVFLDEQVVIHQVRLIQTADKETGAPRQYVYMPERKRGEEYERVVRIKDPDVRKQIETEVKAAVQRAMNKDLGDYHLQVDVRLYTNGDTRGYASILFNDSVEIRNVRLYERDGQIRISYPYEKKDDAYQNLAGPASLFIRGIMEEEIIGAYQRKVAELSQSEPSFDTEDLDNPFEERSIGV